MDSGTRRKSKSLPRKGHSGECLHVNRDWILESGGFVRVCLDYKAVGIPLIKDKQIVDTTR